MPLYLGLGRRYETGICTIVPIDPAHIGTSETSERLEMLDWMKKVRDEGINMEYDRAETG